MPDTGINPWMPTTIWRERSFTLTPWATMSRFAERHGASGENFSWRRAAIWYVEVVEIGRIKFGVDGAKTYLKNLKDHNGNDNRKLHGLSD